MLRLYPAEKTIALIVGAISVATVVLATAKGIVVDWSLFAQPALAALVFIAIGQVLRKGWQAERLALMSTLIGLFVFDAMIFSTYNVMLLPRHMGPADAVLVKIDALMGYSWAGLVTWFADYPWLSDFLRAVYGQTVTFLLLAYCATAILLTRERLHTAAYTALFASLVTIAIWAVVPTAGASAVWTIDPAIEAIVRPSADTAYGARLSALIVNGITDMRELNVGGMIGLPSYHTVMVLIALIAVWPVLILRALALVVLVLSVPAILLHGGHNLVDLFAGAALTGFSWRVASRVHARQEARPLAWKQSAAVPAE